MLAAHTEYTLSYALFATTSGAANPYSFTLEDSVTSELNSFTNFITMTQVPVGVWTTESDRFTTGSDTTYLLSFNFISGPTPAKDVLLTDVSVPEPASFALLGVGAIGLSIASCRRRQSASMSLA